MQINFLKKVVENTAGPDAVRIVALLFEKKDVNEFLIAKKLGLTINQTRNLLYKLSHLGIISSIRKKDKRKGWYIYFWTFNVLKSLEVLECTIIAERGVLQHELDRKKTMRFYKCKICGREANEESALLTDFICSECGEVYELADNASMIGETAKKIERLERELHSIQIEIAQEQEKKDKKLAKVIKKEEKKKKAIRMEKTKERARIRLKENKNSKKHNKNKSLKKKG